MAAPVEATLGLGRPAGEAVEHRAWRHALGVEHGERVVPGLAGVDHERQVVLVGEADLRREHLALHVAGRVVVVVVEPALAHGHDPGRSQQLGQAVEPVAGVVRVKPDGGPHHAGMPSGGRHRVGRAAPVGAHGDQALDPGCGGIGDHLVGDGGIGRTVTVPAEVAVVVGPAQGHERGRLQVRDRGTTLCGMADGLAVGLLGPVHVRSHDDIDVALRGHAARLLVWLALVDRAWSVDDLAERLWPDGPPATARTVIQGVVSRLRRTLPADGPVRIDTVPGGYRLRSTAGDDVRSPVDVRRFRALADRALADRALAEHTPAAGREGGDARAAARALAEALALWRGEALAGVRDDPALDREGRALDDERRSAQTALAAALIAGDDVDRALSLLGRLVNDDPLDERRWALLMTGLARAGRQTDALRAYRRAVAVLADRTGLEPGPELRRLETAILVQDPSLGGPRWRPATGGRWRRPPCPSSRWSDATASGRPWSAG